MERAAVLKRSTTPVGERSVTISSRRSTSPRRPQKRPTRPTTATSCSWTAFGRGRNRRSTRRPFWARRCSTCRQLKNKCRHPCTPCRARPERESPSGSPAWPGVAGAPGRGGPSGRRRAGGAPWWSMPRLSWRCCNGHVEIVRALLDFGMSPFRKAVSGKTAFDYAHPHPPVARLLRPRILVSVRTCVLGTAAEYPCRNRLRDLVPHIASYII